MPTTADQLAALAELDRLLREHSVDYWLFGGWAVDFHVGRVTREHADIDVAVWVARGRPTVLAMQRQRSTVCVRGS